MIQESPSMQSDSLEGTDAPFSKPNLPQEVHPRVENDPPSLHKSTWFIVEVLYSIQF